MSIANQVDTHTNLYMLWKRALLNKTCLHPCPRICNTIRFHCLEHPKISVRNYRSLRSKQHAIYPCVVYRTKRDHQIQLCDE